MSAEIVLTLPGSTALPRVLCMVLKPGDRIDVTISAMASPRERLVGLEQGYPIAVCPALFTGPLGYGAHTMLLAGRILHVGLLSVHLSDEEAALVRACFGPYGLSIEPASTLRKAMQT